MTMDGHRTYIVTRQRLIQEAVRVVAPNELVAKRLANNLDRTAWRETQSSEETVLTIKSCERKHA